MSPIAAATCSAAVHREDPGEHPEPTEEHLLDLVQPVVAPIDRRGQGLLPGKHRAGTAGEEMEPIVELRRDPLRRHLPAARGRQLQSERNAVEPEADLSDGRSVLLGDRRRSGGPGGPGR